MDSLIGRGAVGGQAIYAFGATLGGATAIQYAAIEPRCKGVMAFAPFKDARSVAGRIMLVFAPTMGQADFNRTLARAGELANFDPADASSVEAARKFAGPLLLVHSLLDVAVPFSDSQAIYDACRGKKKLDVLMPGPEQIAWVVWEDWIASAIDQMARGNLEVPLPTTAPTASSPAAPATIPSR
jgi:cephalosporin-C deacetylase-like acetyl esterase